MKAFRKESFGIFIAPSDIEAEIKRQYKVNVIGRVDEVEEIFYAITIEWQIMHPTDTTVVKATRGLLSATRVPGFCIELLLRAVTAADF